MSGFLRKLMAIICAVALLAALVPAMALADETAGGSDQDEVKYYYGYDTNPLYEEAAEDETVWEAPLLAGTLATDESTEDVVCESEKEVLDVIRQNGVDRISKFSVDWKTSIDTSEWSDTTVFKTFVSALLKKAYGVHTGNPKEGDALLWGWRSWSCSIKASTNRVVFNFTILYYSTAEQEEEVDQALETLYDDLALEGKNDYEIIDAVYDYITDNVVYDNLDEYADWDFDPDSETYYEKVKTAEEIAQYKKRKNESHSLYAAVINHKCVCQGYALMLYRILLDHGIDCRLAAGYVSGTGHAWNIVDINGTYYEVDSTWDAKNSYSVKPTYQYYLKGSVYMTRKYHTISSSLCSLGSYNISSEDFVALEYSSYEPWDCVTSAVTASGKCSGSISWFLHEDGVLSVVGSGAIRDFVDQERFDETVAYDCPWEDYKSQITTVLFIGPIKRIGNNAFAECANVTEVIYCADETGEAVSIGYGNPPLGNTIWRYRGDVNGDGEISSKDVTALARHLSRIEKIYDIEAGAVMDTNGDGKVGAADITHLAQYLAGIIERF